MLPRTRAAVIALIDVSRCEQTGWEDAAIVAGAAPGSTLRLLQLAWAPKEIEHALDDCRYSADLVASGFQFSHSGEPGPPLADWCSGGRGFQPAKPAPTSVKSVFPGGTSWLDSCRRPLDLLHEIQLGRKERKS